MSNLAIAALPTCLRNTRIWLRLIFFKLYIEEQARLEITDRWQTM